MKIGILGTGMVGNTIGSKLIKLGHQVKMGSRTVSNERAREWVISNGKSATNGTFADAAAFGEILFNCISGKATLEALQMAGEENMSKKILIDVSNALQIEKGLPLTLAVSNTDSLGEQIQRAFPETKVVKTLNTVNCKVMVEPMAVAGGDHDIFMSGDDDGAKKEVRTLLKTFGWKDEHIHDLGNMTTARGPEQLLPLWARLAGVMGTAMFQFKIVK